MYIRGIEGSIAISVKKDDMRELPSHLKHRADAKRI